MAVHGIWCTLRNRSADRVWEPIGQRFTTSVRMIVVLVSAFRR